MTDSFTLTSLRKKAREALKGKWGMSVVAVLVYLTIAIAATFLDFLIPFVGSMVAMIFFTNFLAMGAMWLFLDVSNGKDVAIETIFEAFKDYVRYLTGGVLVFVYTFLWALLLIIPGIIKSYSYSMTYFIMRENPDITGEQAIQLSMKMMKGYKWKLFLLQLSFIGWVLLGIITLGIGLLWVEAYILTAFAEFYKELKKEYEVRVAVQA